MKNAIATVGTIAGVLIAFSVMAGSIELMWRLGFVFCVVVLVLLVKYWMFALPVAMFIAYVTYKQNRNA